MENSKAEWSEFEQSWTNQIVASINSLRQAQDLTVKQLALRLRRLGWPVSDSTLSGMLSGNKRSSVSVPEVAAFARALSVSPMYIILGLPHSSAMPQHQIWPWNPAEVLTGYRWLSGFRSMRYSADDAEDAKSRLAASASQNTMHLIDRTVRISDIIWYELSDMVALDELIELPQQWRKTKTDEVLDGLSQSLSSLRRLRERFRIEASSNPLQGSFELPPMPQPLSFVDGDLPIREELARMSPATFKELAPQVSVDGSKKGFSSLFDAETDKLQKLEVDDGSPA